MVPLSVVYQDEHLIATNKPSGLLVHRSLIDRHETRFALQMLRDQIGRRVYPLHRLDKPTSGILLFALSAPCARAMTEQFSGADVAKHYLAVVRGYAAAEGRVDYALKEEQDRLTDARADPNKAAQSAVTGYRCLARCELPFPVGRYATARYSLLSLRPETGRKHQLRRHMKHIFHPIIGDTTHGDGRQNRFFRERFDNQRLLLHCQHMAFRHPATGEAINVQAPLDEAFGRVLDETGLRPRSL